MVFSICQSLCAQSCSKHFTCNSSFNPHNNSVSRLFWSCYKKGNWVREWLSNSFKRTQLLSGRVRLWTLKVRCISTDMLIYRMMCTSVFFIHSCRLIPFRSVDAAASSEISQDVLSGQTGRCLQVACKGISRGPGLPQSSFWILMMPLSSWITSDKSFNLIKQLPYL